MSVEPHVVEVEISYAKELLDVEFMLEGSARALLNFDDGNTDEFFWFHDELSFAAEDFMGKTMAEIRETHRIRDIAYLQTP